jgi:hypothetical protein
MPIHEAWLHVLTRKVTPGQPIKVRWALRRTGDPFVPNPDLNAGVVARILIDGLVVATTPPTPTDPAAEQITALQDAVVADISPALAKVIYKIGYHPVSIQIQGIANNYWLGSHLQEVVSVNREIIDSSWWEWTSPEHQEIEWKKPYQMAGRLVNKSAWGIMSTAYLTLSDTGYDGTSVTILGPAGLMNPGTKVPLMSASITKDWEWFVKGVHFPKGPRKKSFVYVVRFTFVDDYGNSYDEVASTEVAVRVTVADKKLVAFAAAWGLTVIAAGYAIAGALAAATIIGGFSAPAFFGLAASFYAAALAAYVIANDPPEPDERFLEQVDLKRLQLPDGFESEAPADRMLVERITRILEADQILTRIHGRLLGARSAQSSEGTKMQASAYVEAERLLVEHVEALPRTAEAALRELSSVVASDPFQEAARAWSDGDLSEEVRRHMIELGALQEAIDDFDAVVTTREGAEMLLAGWPFGGIIEALQEFARAVQSESPTALEGN